MKLSVITVCHNAAGTIEDCLRSVKLQDYPNLEHVIIDGGSTDGTLEIIQRYPDKVSQIVSEPDSGIYDAMNKGLSLASGETVGFLNADDYFSCSTAISHIAGVMQEHHAQAVYGDLDYIDIDDTSKVVRRWKSGSYHKGAFRKGWVPPHPTFYCRKEVYDRLGGYHDEFKIAADFELMLRFLEKYQISIVYLPEVLVKMRTGGKANVLAGMIRGNIEILRAFQINKIKVSPFFFVVKPLMKIRQLWK